MNKRIMYKWMSLKTGEIAENFWQVLKAIWLDLTKYNLLNLKWKYNKNGF